MNAFSQAATGALHRKPGEVLDLMESFWQLLTKRCVSIAERLLQHLRVD